MPPIKDDDGVIHCKGCDKVFPTRKQAVIHEVHCPEARNFLKNIAYWVSDKFIAKYNFDKRLRLTKMFHYLFFRFVLDILAFLISVLVIVGRILAIYEVNGIPFSGTMEGSNEAVLIIVFAAYIAIDRFHAIEEFYYMVIQQMPKFKEELGKATAKA